MGSFSGPGSQRCMPCNIGTFQNMVGQASCIPAQAGHFAVGTGSTKQIPCEIVSVRACRTLPGACLHCLHWPSTQPMPATCL